MNSPISRLREIASDEQQAYSRGAERPLGGYLASLAVYGSLVTGLGAAARLTGRRLPDERLALISLRSSLRSMLTRLALISLRSSLRSMLRSISRSLRRRLRWAGVRVGVSTR